MHQIVPDGVNTVAVKLHVVAFFQTIKFFPHLACHQQQHLRASLVLIVEDQAIEQVFDLLADTLLNVIPRGVRLPVVFK